MGSNRAEVNLGHFYTADGEWNNLFINFWYCYKYSTLRLGEKLHRDQNTIILLRFNTNAMHNTAVCSLRSNSTLCMCLSVIS
jgi:hypothetical protein